jgi:transposase-like protein
MNKECPVCGLPLKKKRIKKGSTYRRRLQSYVCEDCNYSEYDSNDREQAITDGYLDDEIGILK